MKTKPMIVRPENNIAMLGEMLTYCENAMKNIKEKGLQTDPLYLAFEEQKLLLQNGVNRLQDINRCYAERSQRSLMRARKYA